MSSARDFETPIPREVIEWLQRPFQRSEYVAARNDLDGLALLRAASDSVRAARESGVPEELQRRPGERTDDWQGAYDRLQSIPPDWRRITMLVARTIVRRGFTVELAYAVDALIRSMTFRDPPEAPPDWLMRMPSPAWYRRARGRFYDLERSERGRLVPDRNKGWYLDMLYNQLPEMVVLAERVRGRLCFHPDAVVQHRVLEQQFADGTPRTVLAVCCPRCDAFMSQLVPEGSSVEMAMRPALLREDDALLSPAFRSAMEAVDRAASELGPALRFASEAVGRAVSELEPEQPDPVPRDPDPRVFETEPHDGYCPMVVEGSSLPDDLRGWVR